MKDLTAEAGVNIETLYFDHAHQLILVVGDPARGREVAAAWYGETDRPAPTRSTGARP